MTVKELKELIADLPDDAPVFAMDRQEGEYEAEAGLTWFRWSDKWKWWKMLHGKPKKPGAARGGIDCMNNRPWWVNWLPKQWRWSLLQLIMEYADARIASDKAKVLVSIKLLDGRVVEAADPEVPEYRRAAAKYTEILDALGLR